MYTKKNGVWTHTLLNPPHKVYVLNLGLKSETLAWVIDRLNSTSSVWVPVLVRALHVYDLAFGSGPKNCSSTFRAQLFKPSLI